MCIPVFSTVQLQRNVAEKIVDRRHEYRSDPGDSGSGTFFVIIGLHFSRQTIDPVHWFLFSHVKGDGTSLPRLIKCMRIHFGELEGLYSCKR